MSLQSTDVKHFAAELGADLCGVASVDRFVAAPKGHHPQDIFPGCRSVIVLACEFPRDALGAEEGEFCLCHSGEIRFRFARDERWFYVNRGLAEFQAAARIFNAFSWSAYDFDDPECDYFDEMASRFSAAQEKIEPLGDQATSLWSATVHDTEAGLWTLY